MTTSRVTLDDHRLLALYVRFQGARRSLGEIYSNVRHDDSLDGSRYARPAAMMVSVLAQEHILTTANAVNRFCYDLHSIEAWNKVFESANEAEKMIALYEFLFPVASQALSAPYAIKQMLVKSICEISHQTNRFCSGEWNERALREKPNFPDAQRLAARYRSWPALHDALSLVSDVKFSRASADYRHEFNHGFPRRIEVGHTTVIRRDPTLSSYRWVDAPPLLLVDLIPLLAVQHKAINDSYYAYIELIREQHEIWMGGCEAQPNGS